MASRKEQKEQARARRLAEEQERRERERRTRRIQMLGGTVLTAVALVAVAIAISAGGSSGNTTGLQKGKALSSTETTVKGLLAGIPQSGDVLGQASASVTLTYYGDLECPVCQAFTLQGGFPQLVSNDVKQGKVKVKYLDFETATRDPSVFKTQQVAALAAGKQNQFWYYAELFYHEQGVEGSGYVTPAFLSGLAQQTHDLAGLSVSKWQSDRSDPAMAAQATAGEASANANNVSGTPTLIAQGPKGKQPVVSSTGVPSYSELEQAIKAVA